MRTDIAVVLDHESALTFAIIVLYHYGPLRIEKTIFDGHRVLNPQSRDWSALIDMLIIIGTAAYLLPMNL